MNRPKIEDYAREVYWERNFIIDMNAYCDELEATLKCTQDSWRGTSDNLDKYMKALDKAIEQLQEAHFVSLVECIYPYYEKDKWKERLLNDE